MRLVYVKYQCSDSEDFWMLTPVKRLNVLVTRKKTTTKNEKN